jgi:hypothetical protein
MWINSFHCNTIEFSLLAAEVAATICLCDWSQSPSCLIDTRKAIMDLQSYVVNRCTLSNSRCRSVCWLYLLENRRCNDVVFHSVECFEECSFWEGHLVVHLDSSEVPATEQRDVPHPGLLFSNRTLSCKTWRLVRSRHLEGLHMCTGKHPVSCKHPLRCSDSRASALLRGWSADWLAYIRSAHQVHSIPSRAKHIRWRAINKPLEDESRWLKTSEK